MSRIVSAVVLCTTCDYKREITRSEAWNDDPVRSAKQAGKGHVSGSECDHDALDIDVIEG